MSIAWLVTCVTIAALSLANIQSTQGCVTPGKADNFADFALNSHTVVEAVLAEVLPGTKKRFNATLRVTKIFTEKTGGLKVNDNFTAGEFGLPPACTNIKPSKKYIFFLNPPVKKADAIQSGRYKVQYNPVGSSQRNMKFFGKVLQGSYKGEEILKSGCKPLKKPEHSTISCSPSKVKCLISCKKGFVWEGGAKFKICQATTGLWYPYKKGKCVPDPKTTTSAAETSPVTTSTASTTKSTTTLSTTRSTSTTTTASASTTLAAESTTKTEENYVSSTTNTSTDGKKIDLMQKKPWLKRKGPLKPGARNGGLAKRKFGPKGKKFAGTKRGPKGKFAGKRKGPKGKLAGKRKLGPKGKLAGKRKLGPKGKLAGKRKLGPKGKLAGKRKLGPKGKLAGKRKLGPKGKLAGKRKPGAKGKFAGKKQLGPKGKPGPAKKPGLRGKPGIAKKPGLKAKGGLTKKTGVRAKPGLTKTAGPKPAGIKAKPGAKLGQIGPKAKPGLTKTGGPKPAGIKAKPRAKPEQTGPKAKPSLQKKPGPTPAGMKAIETAAVLKSSSEAQGASDVHSLSGNTAVPKIISGTATATKTPETTEQTPAFGTTEQTPSTTTEQTPSTKPPPTIRTPTTKKVVSRTPIKPSKKPVPVLPTKKTSKTSMAPTKKPPIKPTKKPIVTKKPVTKKPIIKPTASKIPPTKKTIVTKKPIVKPTASKIPPTKKTIVTKKPVTKKPIIKPTASKIPPTKKTIVTKKPIVKPTASKIPPTKKTIVTKKPVTKKPIIKPTASKIPPTKKTIVTRKPVTKKPIVKPTASKIPPTKKTIVTRKPVTKKPTLKTTTTKIIESTVSTVTEQKITKAPVTTKKPIVSTKKPIPTRKPVPVSKKTIVTTKKTIVTQPTVTTKKPVVTSKKPITATKKPVSTKKPLITKKPIIKTTSTTQKPVPTRKPTPATKKPVRPTKKSIVTKKPTKKPVKPVKKPVKPIKKPIKPIKKPVKPIKKPIKPIRKPVKPIKKPVKPIKKPFAKKPGTKRKPGAKKWVPKKKPGVGPKKPTRLGQKTTKKPLGSKTTSKKTPLKTTTATEAIATTPEATTLPTVATTTTPEPTTTTTTTIATTTTKKPRPKVPILRPLPTRKRPAIPTYRPLSPLYKPILPSRNPFYVGAASSSGVAILKAAGARAGVTEDVKLSVAEEGEIWVGDDGLNYKPQVAVNKTVFGCPYYEGNFTIFDAWGDGFNGMIYFDHLPKAIVSGWMVKIQFDVAIRTIETHVVDFYIGTEDRTVVCFTPKPYMAILHENQDLTIGFVGRTEGHSWPFVKPPTGTGTLLGLCNKQEVQEKTVGSMFSGKTVIEDLGDDAVGKVVTKAPTTPPPISTKPKKITTEQTPAPLKKWQKGRGTKGKGGAGTGGKVTVRRPIRRRTRSIESEKKELFIKRRCEEGYPNGVLPLGGQTAPSWILSNDGDTMYDYNEVMHKSNLFYMAQRSGKLAEDNPIPWRGDSAMKDGCKDNLPLYGGWYNGEGHVKSTFPMAFTTTMLAWGGIDYKKAYQDAKEYGQLLSNIRWSADYLIRCHTKQEEFVVQVGDYNETWSRPEEIGSDRHVYVINSTNPGQDIAAEGAAALAATALLFKTEDPAYSRQCLRHSRQLYAFAQKYPGKYKHPVQEIRNKYNSDHGTEDELAWATAWLGRAVNSDLMVSRAEKMYAKIKTAYPSNLFYWDDKTNGLLVLLAKLTKKEEYKTELKSLINTWIHSAQNSKTKQLWMKDRGNNMHIANLAFLTLQTAEMFPNLPFETAANSFARQQLDMMLGDSGRSYVVGIGKSYPKRPCHMASSCPDLPAKCNQTILQKSTDNPQILYGALIGGPGIHGQYTDDINEDIYDEIAIDFNAGFQSAIAGLKQLSLLGESHSLPGPLTRGKMIKMDLQ